VTTRSDDVCASSSKARASSLADAITLLTSEAEEEANSRASASPKPREAPVMRNVAIVK
jgi:hypothetical protein